MPGNREAVITTRNLTRCWGRVRAVDDVSLAIRRGERFCVIGPNGAGKTTLLSLLGGLILPKSGEVCVFGMDRWRENFAIRCRSTFLPIEFEWGASETPYEFLCLYAEVYGMRRPEFQERMESLAAEMNMTAYLDKPFTELTTGMRKKAGLIAAFLPSIKLRILDEPFAGGIDPMAMEQLYTWFNASRDRDETLVFSTQYLEPAEVVADRLLVLESGRATHLGTPLELVAQAGIAAGEPRALARAFVKLVAPEARA